MATIPFSAGGLDMLLLILFLLCILLWIRFRRPVNFPPGPTPIPFIGNFHNLRNSNLLQVMRELRSKYGDIFSLSLGSFWVVVVNGSENLRELLVKRADFTSDRPPTLRFNVKKKGILAASGDEWKHKRTFTLSKLRDFGFGKRSFEQNILEEINFFIGAVEEYKGKPFDISGLIHNSMSNNIMLMTVGRRFEYDDQIFRYFIELLDGSLSRSPFSSVANFTPILNKLPVDIFGMRNATINIAKIREFLGKEIKEHERTLDINNIRDFIDVYLMEMKHQGTNEDDIYTGDHLQEILFDLFGAGTDTSATTVRWFILFLLHNRDVQNKMWTEINEVVGSGRLPSMSDKPNLPYCDAVLQESLRLGNIVPFSLPHHVSSDIYFKQYKIPKNAVLFASLDSVANDESVFPDSHSFKPERFLDENGKTCGHGKFFPFLLGRRKCLGEALARMELFLYMTSLVQRFEFLPQQDESLPSLEGHMGVTHSPKPFIFRAIIRN